MSEGFITLAIVVIFITVYFFGIIIIINLLDMHCCSVMAVRVSSHETDYSKEEEKEEEEEGALRAKKKETQNVEKKNGILKELGKFNLSIFQSDSQIIDIYSISTSETNPTDS
jgi:hypothetical protein